MDTRKLYGFYSDGSKKLNGTLLYSGWFTEEDMQKCAIGMVIGLKAYCSTAKVYVYEVEKIDVPEGAHPYRAKALVRIQDF